MSGVNHPTMTKGMAIRKLYREYKLQKLVNPRMYVARRG